MKSTRLLTAAVATAVALGVSAFAVTPAQAAVTKSFSNSSADGASWGTVTFTNYSYTADVYIYRDSSASISFQICADQFLNNGAPAQLPNTCRSASNGGSIGSTRHVTLSASENIAKIGFATTYQYVNGAYADGDWTYAF
ncbi:hypothetical protein [Paractinoplanes globisporus]|uniref:Uncharacterized protein n=1 Tax=Paractinoplanes globisporus TaxID=113565 RepID=A0ABW6WL98_9ACTN|nr:hypothetical protein [Actinoplanes globisporus]